MKRGAAKLRWVEGRAQRPVLRVDEPRKMGACSALVGRVAKIASLYMTVCRGGGFRMRGLFVIREGLVDQYLVTPNAYNRTRTGSSVYQAKEIVCVNRLMLTRKHLKD
jgi:hypothetical protein